MEKIFKGQDAVSWMLNNPLKQLYDEYGNYFVWGPYSNMIEYYQFTGDWEDEDGNFVPGDWDMDRYSVAEFFEQFGDLELETN